MPPQSRTDEIRRLDTEAAVISMGVNAALTTALERKGLETTSRRSRRTLASFRASPALPVAHSARRGTMPQFYFSLASALAALALGITAMDVRAEELSSKSGPIIVDHLAKLDNPWGMTKLPDGRLLITEKPPSGRAAGQRSTAAKPTRAKCVDLNSNSRLAMRR